MTLNASGVGPYSQAGGIVNFASGGYTGDGSGSILVSVGFTPRFVKVYDMTDGTIYEWAEGMPATDSIKTTTAPAQSVDTNSAVVTNGAIVTVTTTGVYPPGTQEPGDGTLIGTSVTYNSPNLALPQLTLGSVCNVNSKVYAWIAFG
jgi:hypothetical protein